MRKKDERGREEGREMERSLEALKHFALPAQQMPHSVWHSDLWACSIYTLTVSLQGQQNTRNTHTHLASGFCSSPAMTEMRQVREAPCVG